MIFFYSYTTNKLGKPSKIKNKKVWNFPYFSGVGGFEKVIFHKNKNKIHGLKMPKMLFLFFFHTRRVGWMGFEKYEIPYFFIFYF